MSCSVCLNFSETVLGMAGPGQIRLIARIPIIDDTELNAGHVQAVDKYS